MLPVASSPHASVPSTTGVGGMVEDVVVVVVVVVVVTVVVVWPRAR